MTGIRALVLTTICFGSAASALELTATVTAVTPMTRQIVVNTPYQDCYIDTVYVAMHDDQSMTNELLGAVIGGVIGNTIGSGDGQELMTAMGTLIGASIANDHDRQQARDNRRAQHVEKCVTRYRQHSETVVDFYQITYEYAGQHGNYTTRNEPPVVGDVIAMRMLPAQ